MSAWGGWGSNPSYQQHTRCHPIAKPQVLSVHLLHEAFKGAASFWHLYIRQLPRSYTTLCCFTDAAVDALQLPFAQAAARDAIEKTKDDWKGAWRLLQELGACVLGVCSSAICCLAEWD